MLAVHLDYIHICLVSGRLLAAEFIIYSCVRPAVPNGTTVPVVRSVPNQVILNAAIVLLTDWLDETVCTQFSPLLHALNRSWLALFAPSCHHGSRTTDGIHQAR